jgi:hypothetical protein
MANETPNDLGESVEVLAIRRVRHALGKADGALAEVERLFGGTPSISPEAITKAAVLALGEFAEVAHEVRHELLALYELYPI